VLGMVADSQVLVRMYWPEDITFPKQHCIHVCKDVTCTYTIHIKCRHYSLGTGDIDYSTVNDWWKN
jgi:hypothetical protein